MKALLLAFLTVAFAEKLTRKENAILRKTCGFEMPLAAEGPKFAISGGEVVLPNQYPFAVYALINIYDEKLSKFKICANIHLFFSL
ncbi:hypothetical protein OESDEN_16397 [Oesophagostomum dentatum]|uniref:Uncharacterized protein n=1 Tax=Oesophagostomum dentatum TaxID=61180 RepID=A0A0B1SJ29_OESDE|nr:hypothetical protein OESDEN_16397 [Oesophagostomum dentatum]